MEFFENQGGYAMTFFAGDQKLEAAMKEKFGVTIRCMLPVENSSDASGTCIFTGQTTTQKVIWAKSY
jgi:hypothetical protein